MRLRLPAAAVAAVFVLAVVPSGATANRQPKLCGHLTARHVGYSVTVEHGVVSCWVARSVLRAYFTAPRSQCGGSHCLIRVRGYDCIAGSWDELKAAECTRGRRVLRAYIADV
jgi:hypothetical protein